MELETRAGRDTRSTRQQQRKTAARRGPREWRENASRPVAAPPRRARSTGCRVGGWRSSSLYVCRLHAGPLQAHTSAPLK
eukprot:851990-Prymnesium_polylepis.1